MASTYAPLPEPREDERVQMGYALREQLPAKIQEVRLDPMMSDLAKAEKIDKLWRTTCTLIEEQRDEYSAQRRQRLSELEAVIPIGPAIPADANPADAAALQQAFRAALVEVRGTAQDQVPQLLADAERFDDELLRRAVITVAVDNGYAEIVTRWRDARPSLAEQFDELFRLRNEFAGMSIANLWTSQAFEMPEQPQESRDLPQIQAAAEVLRQQAQASADRMRMHQGSAYGIGSHRVS